MRSELKKMLRRCHRLKLKVVVKRAPTDAVTFDRIIVIFRNDSVDQVVLYDSRIDKILGM